MRWLILAYDCFPNCHPAGYHGGPVAESGSAALGAAAVGALLLLFLSRRNGGNR